MRGAVLARQRDRIGAAPGGVAGVEQQGNRGAGGVHHRVDVVGAFDNGAHVVVIGDADAFGQGAVGDLRQPPSPFGPVAAAQTRPLRQRFGAVAMDGIGGLGEDQHVRAHRLQQIEMRPQRCHLGVGVALQQFSRIPAGDAGHAERLQRRLQRGGLARKLVAELHADEADLPGLGEACFQRGVAADLLQVVVGPADRVGADANGHVLKTFLVIQVARRAPPHLGALRDLRHRDVPPGAAGIGGFGRIGIDHDHRGARVVARPCAARLRVRRFATFSAIAPRLAAWAAKSISGSVSCRAVASRIVERARRRSSAAAG